MHGSLYVLHVGACRENGENMAECDWMLWFDDMEKEHGLAMWVLLCMHVCERICFHCRLLGCCFFFFYNSFWVQDLL